MDKEKLIEEISNIININAAQLFFVLKKDNTYTIKLADLESGMTQSSIAEMFGGYIQSNLIENENLFVGSLSVDDERENAIYLYDYDEYSDELEIIRDFKIVDPDDINQQAITFEHFNFNDDNLSNLYGFIITYGSMQNNIILFKKFYPISLIKRDAYLLGAVKSSSRFKKIDENDILRINGKFELLKIHNYLYVLDIKCIENNLKFKKRIKKDADNLIEAIKKIDILDDIETISELKDDNSTLRKLSKASKSSPILNSGKSKEDIMSFIKKDPKISSKFKYNEDGSKLRLDTKKAKNEFLKLLQDSFLNSGLTDIMYDVKTKDVME
ncbi:MAG: anti-phage protein KwaB [Lachnospiraceae bacterium]